MKRRFRNCKFPQVGEEMRILLQRMEMGGREGGERQRARMGMMKLSSRQRKNRDEIYPTVANLCRCGEMAKE